MIINSYYINGYWRLFHYKPLVIILFVVIDGYFINGYYIITIGDYYYYYYYYLIFYVIISLDIDSSG